MQNVTCELTRDINIGTKKVRRTASALCAGSTTFCPHGIIFCAEHSFYSCTFGIHFIESRLFTYLLCRTFGVTREKSGSDSFGTHNC